MRIIWPGHAGDGCIKLWRGFVITNVAALSPGIYNCRIRQSYQEGLLGDGGLEKALILKGNLINVGVGADALFEGAKEEVIGFELAASYEMGGVPDLDSTVEELIDNWRFSCNREADVLELVASHSPEEFYDPACFDDPPDSKDPRDSNFYYETHGFLPTIYDASLFRDNFQYLGAERISPRLFYETSDYQVRRHKQLGTKGEYTAHFLSIFGDDDILNKKLAHEEAFSYSLKHQVEAWLGEISPGIRLSLTPNPNMDIVELRYSSALGTQTSNNYRAANVGFGVTYALPIIVAVLHASPDSLLLIENPEAHLHPQGQSQMGRLLACAASCGVQIIVETHSDHVLNGMRVAVYEGLLNPDDVQLHFFQRGRDGLTQVISPTINRDARIHPWPDGFFDEWDKNLEALLEPRDK